MYLETNSGAPELVCDKCQKSLKEITGEYIIYYHGKHFCPPCWKLHETYKRRIQRIKELKDG